MGIAVSDDMENWELAGEVPLEYEYEQKGIGAPAAIVIDNKVHLFYQTYGRWELDSLCHAVSDDGAFFRRVFNTPFIPCGKEGEWNSSESGHPYAFRDDDGRAYLFYQGSSDMGKTWYLSKCEIAFDKNNVPYIV